jgi:DNA-binding transcriptional MerR regulator/quercetin dioxygenase-like cupin family protein
MRIGEVARKIGVSPSTVRAWERKGLVQPRRIEGGHRRYRAEDVERLRQTRSLLTRGGYAPALRTLLSGQDGVPLAGARLRAARAKRGLSLRVAAQRAGVSAAFLSLVERGLAEPSVALLQRVTAAYGGTLLEFFGAAPKNAATVKLVKAGERMRLQGFDRVAMEHLVAFPGAVLQVDIFTVEAGGGSGGGYMHEGEESIFVLEGQLDVWLDEVEHYHLDTGDTLYFQSTQQHRWGNLGEKRARVFWINTPPTF